MTTQTETRPCTSCKGEGTRPHWQEGKPPQECSACKGKCFFEAPDVDAILKEIMTRQGKFRQSWPSNKNVWKNRSMARAYYVWRLARFHGGKDVTMPMTADLMTRGDSWKKELDAMSDVVAKKAFGTDMAAAYRWGAALGFAKSPPRGCLPATAYEGGPVADHTKPKFEAAELGEPLEID